MTAQTSIYETVISVCPLRPLSSVSHWTGEPPRSSFERGAVAESICPQCGRDGRCMVIQYFSSSQSYLFERSVSGGLFDHGLTS